MLTTEERAARRVKKFNKRTASELPLFAATNTISQFLTTQEEQVQAVINWDALNKIYFQALEHADKIWLEQAQEYRSELAKLITTDELIDLDITIKSLIEKWSAFQNNPVYIADWWHGKLTDAQNR